MSSPFDTKKSLREHLVALTKELISFPSHAEEPQKNFEIIDFIKAYFEHDNVKLHQYVFQGSPSLVVTFEETKHPNVILSGHADVVATSTLYTAEERDGKLFGSGAMDMKSGVACMMAAMKFFACLPARQAAQEQRPSIGLMITTDEEMGGYRGTYELLKTEGYRPNFAIINEGREKYDIVLREKGKLSLKFVCKNRGAHSAYPWKTESALECLMTALLKVKKIFPRPKDRWMTTAAVTVFHAGKEVAPNVIPDRAEAIMSVRLTGEGQWNRDAIIAKIKSVLPKEVEVLQIDSEEVALADEKNPHVLLLRECAEKVTGRKMKFGENHGASDAKFFAQHRIPFAILGPSGVGLHSAEEYGDIDSFVTHFEVLREFIEREKTHLHTAVEALQ